MSRALVTRTNRCSAMAVRVLSVLSIEIHVRLAAHHPGEPLWQLLAVYRRGS